MACDPNFADAHSNLALVRLLLGPSEEGWREYEWRWRMIEGVPRSVQSMDDALKNAEPIP